MIYLIADIEKRWCKIGISRNPKSRSNSIQTGIPFEVEILNVIEGDRKEERNLHQKFKKYHIRGEWFYYNTEIQKHIESINQLPIYENRSIKRIEVISQEMVDNLYAHLLQNYNIGAEICISKQLRVNIGKKLELNERTVLNTLGMLVEKKLIYTTSKSIYKINPRYAYKGSTHNRNRDLKVVLEVECPDC